MLQILFPSEGNLLESRGSLHSMPLKMMLFFINKIDSRLKLCISESASGQLGKQHQYILLTGNSANLNTRAPDPVFRGTCPPSVHSAQLNFGIFGTSYL